jgi:subtilisin family serine protease
MRKKINLVLLSLLVIMFVFTACEKNESVLVEQNDEPVLMQDGDIIPGSYIVVFNNEKFADKSLANVEDYDQRQNLMKDEVARFLSSKSVADESVSNIYSKALFGFSGQFSEEEIVLLRNSSEIDNIYPDRMVMLAPKVKPTPVPSGQTVPWGITRVNGGVDGTGKIAWILDTGVDLDHPDLNVNASLGRTYIPRTTTPDDDNGHGSHCAGIIGAKNNTIGVIGVAANATVIPIKVLDRRGSGAYSGIISGVDYVAANGHSGDVANMSLGGGVYEPIDLAVYNASQSSGVKFILAAGNESDDANNHSPARVNGPNIYTISAMGTGDLWAYFSNYGNPPIDYCAPGVNIYSTYKAGGYTTMSGTSMAAPHAAGVILLGGWHTDGTVINDPDGEPDAIIVH